MIPIAWTHERLPRDGWTARKLSTGLTTRASNVLTARQIQGRGGLTTWIEGAYRALEGAGALDISKASHRVYTFDYDGLTLVYGTVVQPGRRDFKFVVCHPDEVDTVLVDVLKVLR